MKYSLLIPTLIFVSNLALSQSVPQTEINEQIWIPFIDAYNKQDTKAYSAVHSKDFIRVLRDNQKIYGFEFAFRELPDSVKAYQALWKRSIELRFVERIASDNQAFEVGYYRVIYNNESTEEERTSYGKFHVLLRKENGFWKILMDADGNLGVDESVFQSGKKMDE